MVITAYENCFLCPRACGLNRNAGRIGYCGDTAELRISFAGIHRGEEPPITGAGGSGTIFISGCNLGCIFCQNYQISKEKINGSRGIGRIVNTEEFAEICLMLQEKRSENINIVTGSHAAPALALGIEAARKQGLHIPVLWNSSGYDGKETLAVLKDLIDVYLPDLKTLDSSFAARFFNAPNYPESASAAILEMLESRKLKFAAGCDGVTQTMVSGVMVRHLVIPGYTELTRQVLAWFSKNCRGRALLSLMTQYTPVKSGVSAIPDRFVSEDEYNAVLEMLDEYGIDDGFCQELITGTDWLPDFTRQNPFSSELSVPVWTLASAASGKENKSYKTH